MSGKVNFNTPTGGGQLDVGYVQSGEYLVTTPTGPLRFTAGSVTLDGSNPTPATTGLTTIIAGGVSLNTASAPADDPSWLSHNYTTPSGTLNIYAWKNTGGTDPTLVASTSNTAVVDWWAVGY